MTSNQFDIWFYTTEGTLLRHLTSAAALIFMDKVHYPSINTYTFLPELPIIQEVHALIHGCLYGSIIADIDFNILLYAAKSMYVKDSALQAMYTMTAFAALKHGYQLRIMICT